MTIIYAATRAWRGHCSRYLVSSGSSRRLFLACFLGVRADGWRAPPEQLPDSAAFRMPAHGQRPSDGKAPTQPQQLQLLKGKKNPTRTTCNLQSREGISLISLRSSGSGGVCILCSPCLVPLNTGGARPGCPAPGRTPHKEQGPPPTAASPRGWDEFKEAGVSRWTSQASNRRGSLDELKGRRRESEGAKG